MHRAILLTGLLACLVAVPAAAQTCNEEVTVGTFEIVYEGAFFNGTNTEFEYCVTNNGGQALSHWVLSLDTACIDPEDLVDCGPEPCFYQVNDPTTGPTGIKWDDLSIETGETECFEFTLAGDWTASIGNVTIAIKAGQSVETGEICGPVCVNCEASINIVNRNGKLGLKVRLKHNRPPTVIRTIRFAVMDSNENIVHRWETAPYTFEYLSTYEYYGPIPGLDSKLPAGKYIVVMRLDGMSGWHWQTKPFVDD
jgi:hypothetical protein